MAELRFPEFLDSLENTKYPFVDSASLSNGRVAFLEGTFLDAHLYSPSGTSRYYLSRVVVSSGRIELFIGIAGNASLLSGSSPIPISDGTIALRDAYGKPGGILVTEPDRLSIMTSWGVGTHTFERHQTEFCVTCQMPIPDNGVTGLRLESGEIVSGKVWLVGEDGVLISTETVVDGFGTERELVRIDVVGDPLFLQRLCVPASLFTPVNPILVIRIVNGPNVYECTPDENGNFNIQLNDALAADAALRVRTTVAGIVFEVEGTTPVE